MPDYRRGREGEPGWLLAIDTSSDLAGLALYDGSRVFLHQWPCVREQTTQVVPAIHSLLAKAHIAVSELGGVAVASGPGSFTGLRVGMSIAKGLALGNDVPIVGIPTLNATAYPWIQIGAKVIAVLPAGRGRMVWQRFGEDGAIDSPGNSAMSEFVAVLDEGGVDAIVGELTPGLRAGLRDVPVPVMTGPETAVRVGAIASLGWQRLLQGEADDLATLEPVYVHGVRQATKAIIDPQP